MSKKLIIRSTIKKVTYEVWFCDVTGLTPDSIDYLMQQAYPVDGVDGWKLMDRHDGFSGESNPELLVIDEEKYNNE